MHTATQPSLITRSCPTCACPRSQAAIVCPFCGSRLEPATVPPPTLSITPSSIDAQGRPTRSATPLHGNATWVLAGGGLVFLLMGLLFMVLFNGLLIRAYQHDANKLAALQQEGVPVRGTISDRYVDSGDDSTEYVVFYHFDAPRNGDPQGFIGEASVSKGDYERLTSGAGVSVTYARSDPNVSAIKGYWPQPSLAFTTGLLLAVNLFLLIFVAVGVGLLAWSLRTMRQAGQLRREGLVATGTVVQCWTDSDSDGDTTYYLGVQFVPAGSGQKIELRQQVGAKTYRNMYQGTSVPIRYLASDPGVAGIDRRLA